MNIFLDTSSLIKLYHKESGTKEIIDIYNTYQVDNVYLSDLAKIEFDSAVWKNFRTKEIDKDKAIELIRIFQKDYEKYIFVDDNDAIKNRAKALINTYCAEGLRTLDSIQLSTAVSLKAKVDLNKSSDKLLTKLFEKEGLVVK